VEKSAFSEFTFLGTLVVIAVVGTVTVTKGVLTKMYASSLFQSRGIVKFLEMINFKFVPKF
jgi:hypothetical protein